MRILLSKWKRKKFICLKRGCLDRQFVEARNSILTYLEHGALDPQPSEAQNSQSSTI